MLCLDSPRCDLPERLPCSSQKLTPLVLSYITPKVLGRRFPTCCILPLVHKSKPLLGGLNGCFVIILLPPSETSG